MKVSLELASNYFEVTEKNLRANSKYSKYISKSMFDMDQYIADHQEHTDESYIYEDENNTATAAYIPLEERKPLEASYIMTEYWAKQKTISEIAVELNVPEYWVYKEIRRLKLGKKERGIKQKGGLKGMVMSKDERKKRQNQPHAKQIVQICPKTYIVVKEYNSQGAVERYGFRRENVRRAIKSCGLHLGYLWAFSDLKEATIRVAKRREDLTKRKLQAFEYKRPSKSQLHKLYIAQNKTLDECAEIFKCSKITIAILAGKYGLVKRTGKPSENQLREMRIVQNLSIAQIANKLGYTKSTISTYLSRHKIKKGVTNEQNDVNSKFCRQV